jgi:hypothetical protein
VNNIAICCIKKGHHDRAVKLLEVCLGLDADNVKALVRLSDCLDKIGQVVKSKQIALKAQKLAKTDQEKTLVQKRLKELS